jgi:hypothetical protein
LRFGFAEKHDVPAALQAQADVVGCDPADASFFLGREIAVPSLQPEVPLWQEPDLRFHGSQRRQRAGLLPDPVPAGGRARHQDRNLSWSPSASVGLTKALHHIGYGPVVPIRHCPDNVENGPLGMVLSVRSSRSDFLAKSLCLEGMGHPRGRAAGCFPLVLLAAPFTIQSLAMLRLQCQKIAK